jgi:hypothetical protein
MDASTVSAADFANAGTAAVSWGTITETAPGVFSLAVTPLSAGTLRLQVAQDAELMAADGGRLNTASAIPDETVITVTLAGANWITGVGIAQVSSIFSANRSADNIINGNGFTEATGFHSSAGGDGISWTSNTSTANPLPHFITFDLAANYDLASVKIWNWNTTSTLSAGSKDIAISVASEVGGAFTLLGSFVLTIGPGQNSVDFGQVINLSGFGAADDVRLVRIDIKSNHGWSNASFPGLAGLSEIRFSGTLVPTNTYATWIADPAFGLAPGEQGLDQDPDGDGLANGLEAWFGTHPGEFNAGLANLATAGTTTTFAHPQNESLPSDLTGFYEWSPNLIDWYAGDGADGPASGPTVAFSVETVGTTTRVSAEASVALERLFLRAGVVRN